MARERRDPEWQAHYDAFLAGRPCRTLYATFAEDWPCDACRGWIAAGDSVALTGSSIVHEQCPRRWTPTVIDGGRTDPQHPQLPFLAAVTEEDT
jgi:hypothetical protein